jgi:hypothetical protein
MTTTVRKGAGRPKATERSNRAAQRTPLPPKPGTITDEMLAEAAHRVELESRTAVQLRAYAREKGYGIPGLSKMAKDDILREILAAESSDQAEEEQGLTSKAVAAATGEAAKAKRQPASKASKAIPAKQIAPGAEALGGTKSAIKAQAFCAEAVKMDWSATAKTEGESTTAIVTRGEETIEITWINGVFQGETCVYSHVGRTGIKIHNASAAKKRMAVPPEAAADEARKVTAHKAARGGARRSTDAKAGRPKELPFNDSSLDDEVIASLRGKTITWMNSISGTEESTRVPAEGERSGKGRIIQVTMREDESGRSINFPGQGGFRSIRISSITEVK